MVGQQPAKVKLQHSVKVPQFYKTAANIAKRASEEHRSLKDLVFNANKHLVSSPPVAHYCPDIKDKPLAEGSGSLEKE
jgi:hypothetical protein